MKILFCFGTRPEAIKMAPLIKALDNSSHDVVICVTGQHREMLDQALEFFKIIPDYDLNLMEEMQSLNKLGAKILTTIDPIIEKENPDLLVVQGDTTSAFISSFAAFNRSIPIAHVEAGLRTYDQKNPFPEEVNRQLISRLASYHMAPTKSAFDNLITEGIKKEQVFLTGNTIVDSLEIALKIINQGFDSQEIRDISNFLIKERKVILVTGHRRENFGAGLAKLCEALIEISAREDVQIIFPVHLNPKVKGMVESKLSNRNNIFLLNPLQYPTFLWLLMQSSLVITDSGGIQEEAPSFNTPVIVTRKLTERMEAVNSGNSIIVNNDSKVLQEKAAEILDGKRNNKLYKNPFGDGKASKRIISILEKFHGI